MLVDMYVVPTTGSLKISNVVTMYHSVALHHSACFILSSGEMTVVKLMFVHGVVVGTSCSDYPVLRLHFMRHLLLGRCIGGKFSGCRSFTKAARDAGIFPHVFCVASIVHSGIINDVGADVLWVYADLFAPLVARNIRRHAKDGAASRLIALRYLPFDPCTLSYSLEHCLSIWYFLFCLHLSTATISREHHCVIAH